MLQDTPENIAIAETWPLIGPDDPPPFTIYNDSGKAPVLMVADHAGRGIPAALQQLGLDDAALNQHIAWDIGSADVARNLADLLDAPLILANYSRLIIDPNRQFDDPSAIPVISDGVVIPGNQLVDEEQKSQRVASFFKPYHGAISQRLDRFAANHITPALLSMHSFTPVYGNQERPWHIGVMWDQDYRIPVPLMTNLGQMEGICVGDNQPYPGRHPYDHTVAFHAASRGIAHVAIEVRQDLIGNAENAQHWAGVLATALAEPLADPDTYISFKHAAENPA